LLASIPLVDDGLAVDAVRMFLLDHGGAVDGLPLLDDRGAIAVAIPIIVAVALANAHAGADRTHLDAYFIRQGGRGQPGTVAITKAYFIETSFPLRVMVQGKSRCMRGCSCFAAKLSREPFVLLVNERRA